MKIENELDLIGNPFTTISHSIAVEMGNLADEAFLILSRNGRKQMGLMKYIFWIPIP